MIPAKRLLLPLHCRVAGSAGVRLGAYNAGISAWMQFLEVFWVKMFPQTALGEVKITSRRVPGGSWRPLGSSGGLLAAVAGVLDSSRSRLGGGLNPKGSHFGALLGYFFGYG